MEKVFNFRDVGGLATEDGRSVKSGLLFRSGMLDDATDDDLKALSNLGLRCIFDFRDLGEVSRSKNPYKELGVERRHHPASLKIDKIYKLQQKPSLKNALQKIYLEDVIEGYKTIAIGNDAYRHLINAVKAKEVPILQHCSAGKDRAGMGIAIILKLLGVKDQLIINDYMKSLEIEPIIREKIGRMIPRLLRKPIFKRFAPLFIVDESFIKAAFAAVIDKYQTFENYFYQEYGLNEKDINEIRDFYLI